MSDRQRLDIAIEQRGLLPSRARARDAILRGTVQVNGSLARKPNQQVCAGDTITLDDPAADYVSRAALKLIAGLKAGGVDADRAVCLDIGASTGGFTQVLLTHGAARVYAVDVGHGQLHETLTSDPRVVPLEGVNARDLTRSEVPEPVDILVADVSFVSLMKVLDAPLSLCAEKCFVILLIKPQFEVGRKYVGSGGIVTDQAAADRAVDAVIRFVTTRGFMPVATLPSPISGGDGNREIVAVFRRG